jgi:tRNA nucleotidyltransferase (CCA-adding enzyme)
MSEFDHSEKSTKGEPRDGSQKPGSSAPEQIQVQKGMFLEALQTKHPFLPSLTKCLLKSGGKAYLVGGSVRDLHRGEFSADLDIEVFGLDGNALETALRSFSSFDKVGQAFGVYKLKGLPVDVSLPRSEEKTGDGHRDFAIECHPNMRIGDAALRRDFTINAIYLDLETGISIDPTGGIHDLQNHLLRHVSSKFSEDALRVYRAMQFIARFNLDCDPETVRLCQSLRGDDLPRERVFAEFEKLLLLGSNIAQGLEFLREVGWLRYFPELEALIDCEQDPQWHPEGDVWTHTLLSLNAFANQRSGDERADLIVGLAVLCHDMGKP